MFKCPKCGTTIPIYDKLMVNIDKHLSCKMCSQQLKPVKVYLYALIFVGPTVLSLLVNYVEMNILAAAGCTIAFGFLLFVFQPLQKV